MSDKDLLLLFLQIIRVNGNVMHLFRLDLSMVQVSQMINNLKSKGFVRVEEEKLSLTENGQKLFCQLNHQLGKKGLYRYLSPDWYYKERPMPLHAVYVPIKKRVRSGKKQSL